MARTTAPALLWFRQDLRLADHPALRAAMADGRPVVPVYVLDDAGGGPWALGGAQRWWLHHSLDSLDTALQERGAHMVLRRGDPVEIIPALAAEIGADAVHVTGRTEPWARLQDDAVAKTLARQGAALHAHPGFTLFDLDAIRTGGGTVYGVFTPFARACRARPEPAQPEPAPKRIVTAGQPASDALSDWDLLPRRPDWAAGLRDTWQPGEAGAARRLQHFLKTALADYDNGRNRPATDGTSMLSPFLHWGNIAPSRAWHLAHQVAADHKIRNGALDTFTNELLWREFSSYLLWHLPHLPDRPLRPQFSGMQWRSDPKALHAWQRGRTGVPMVDAGMRQLWHTGWMHNRVRMVVASFLVKHLLVPWQDGEAWFWDTLVDADLGSNSASWQWVAGCGADAAPFFRVFNPVLQGRKFDPDGDYVRRHVPELAGLPKEHIHAPWDAPEAALRAAGVVLGETYPRPIVGLAEGRDRALAAFKAISAPAA